MVNDLIARYEIEEPLLEWKITEIGLNEMQVLNLLQIAIGVIDPFTDVNSEHSRCRVFREQLGIAPVSGAGVQDPPLARQEGAEAVERPKAVAVQIPLQVV